MATVRNTVLVLVLMIDTVSGPLAAYATLPSGLSATPNGWIPTGTVAATDGVAPVLITDTLPDPSAKTPGPQRDWLRQAQGNDQHR